MEPGDGAPNNTLDAPSKQSNTATMTAPVAYPNVTVCVVAHDPGAWFGEVLQSLVAQDYPALDIFVVDAASDIEVAPRVHAVIPEAAVIPLVANQGFAKNANIILDQPNLGQYVLVCHDDVALAPDCVRRLVEESLRSNAGIVGPKLLDWNDPARILHVGLGADKTGRVSDLAEPGEIDQEQHDVVRDVFVVPGGVTLIRTDLFQALGGYDEVMVVRGEDLDLCWRAHAIGARVMVNPAAAARHREGLDTRVVGADVDQFTRRHRIRSLLSNYGFLHTLRVVPQAMVASFASIVMALFQGRLSTILDIVGAWFWNLARFGSILTKRRQLARVRQIDDSEVRALQQPGFEGLNAFRQRRAERRELEEPNDPVQQAVAERERSRSFRLTLGVWGAVTIAVLFGSRDLIANGLPLFNEFASLPSGPSPLLNEWASSWRPTGVGGEGPPSLLHGLLGFGGIALFGQMGFLRILVTLGLVFVGLIGIWRLLAPFNNVPGQLTAVVVYASMPLPYNAIFEGSWSGLVAFGFLPWIARRLAVAAGVHPFTAIDGARWRRGADLAVLSLLVAGAALVEPAMVLSPALVAFGWLIGSLATRRVVGALRVIGAAVGSMCGAFVLLMPASLSLFSSDVAWSIVAGAEPVNREPLGLVRLARFATGPHGDSLFGWALLVVPLLALILASGPRLAWAARAWMVALAAVGLVIVAERGWVPFALPASVVLVAPAAMSLAFAAGLAAVAVESDLRSYRFGWRQLVPFAAAGALVLSIGAGLGSALDGRWQAVESGYDDVLAFLDERAPGHARAMWIGHDAVLPVSGWNYDDELAFAITPARTPTILDQSIGNPDDIVRALRDDFSTSLDGAGNRLGQQLALSGIRYVIVVESNAPEPFGTIDALVDPVLSDRLGEQLDLVRVPVREGATIYENRSHIATVSRFAPGAAPSGDAVLSPSELALPEVTSLRTYRGLLEPSELYVAVPSDTAWEVEVNGAAQARTSLDWASVFTVPAGGETVLRHQNPIGWVIAAIAQFVVWVALTTATILGRRKRS